MLGFCGAPWTVATYMVAGCGTPDQAPARLFAYRDPEVFEELIDILVDASVEYLAAQIDGRRRCGADFRHLGRRAGARGVRALVHRAGEADRCGAAPSAFPMRKIIGFPRGAGTLLKAYVDSVDVDAVGLDWMIDRGFARDEIQRRRPVQGNLDPLALLAGGAALDREVDAILRRFGNGPFIFNLGHGILPETPIAHVERMIARVRERGRRGSPT